MNLNVNHTAALNSVNFNMDKKMKAIQGILRNLVSATGVPLQKGGEIPKIFQQPPQQNILKPTISQPRVSAAATTGVKPTSGIKINEGGSSSGATGSEMVVYSAKDKGKGKLSDDE